MISSLRKTCGEENTFIIKYKENKAAGKGNERELLRKKRISRLWYHREHKKRNLQKLKCLRENRRNEENPLNFLHGEFLVALQNA